MSHLTSVCTQAIAEAEREWISELGKERTARVEYQDIVFKICNLVDAYGQRCTIDTVANRVREIFSNQAAKQQWAEEEKAWATRCELQEAEIKSLKANGREGISDEWFDGHAALLEEHGNLKAQNSRLQAEVDYAKEENKRLAYDLAKVSGRLADLELQDKVDPHRGRANLNHIHNLYSDFICTDWPSIEQMTDQLRSYMNGCRSSDRILKDQIHELANQLLTRTAVDTRRIGNELLKAIGQVGVRRSNLLIEKDKLSDENVELRRAIRDTITRMDNFFITRKQVKGILKLLLGDLKQVPATVVQDFGQALDIVRTLYTRLEPLGNDLHKVVLTDSTVTIIEDLIDRNKDMP